jgi:uncharacterized protein (TIGR03437 family)
MTAQAQTPAITAVVDAAAYTSDIPQGAVFVVKGTNLASTSAQANVPYPQTLGGVDIGFAPVSGGSSVKAYMYYTYSQGGITQLSGILPSATAPGDYNVKVTTGTGASAAFRVKVVARKFGLITVPSSGSGRAVLQNAVTYEINRFTTGQIAGTSYRYAPAKTGEYWTAWGTGLGAVPGDDSKAPGQYNFLDKGVDVKVLVNSMEITPSYAGRAPQYPGADEIVFQLPANIPTGCELSLQVRVAGQLSNATTISVAPNASADACVDSQFATDVLRRMDNGGTVVVGGLSLNSFKMSMSVPGMGDMNVRVESAGGSFTKYSADQLDRIQSGVATDTCQVFHVTGSQGAPETADLTNLDAGTLVLAGPGSLNKTFTKNPDFSYALNLGMALDGTGLPPITIPGFSTAPVITAGTYTVTGSGGKDVGAFTARINVNQPLSVTGGLPGTVPRNQGLRLAWTGGGSDQVIIEGTSSVPISGTTQYDSAFFFCTTTADKLSFTVPSSILSQLPATPPDAVNSGVGGGTISIFSTSRPATNNGLFTAPLMAGGNIDNGVFLAGIGAFANTIYQ